MLLSTAIDIIERLSDHFGIEAPKASYAKWKSGRTHTSGYYPGNKEIRLSRSFTIRSVLHEFSHALQYSKGGHNHDYIFWNSLYEVTQYYYGDFRKYNWKKEYPRGHKFYLNKVRRLKMYTIEDNVERPQKRKGGLPFEDIKVGGGLRVTLAVNESLEKVATKVRNAVNNFKKGRTDYNLSVHVLKEENQVLVYRDNNSVENSAGE